MDGFCGNINTFPHVIYQYKSYNMKAKYETACRVRVL